MKPTPTEVELTEVKVDVYDLQSPLHNRRRIDLKEIIVATHPEAPHPPHQILHVAEDDEPSSKSPHP